jgi:dipeptidyl aminopeptidase/acylaminoacyl peptidase
MFDPRIRSLAPFEPHPFDELARALPAGVIDEAMYENVKKRYARLEQQTIERITYQSDDEIVTGVFVHPTDITQGSHPLMIFNRGGSGHSGILVLPVILRYMLPFAEKGFLAFGSNYRGNDGGTGEEEFGGSDVNDILNLIDIAKQHPGWDGKNIFMLGGSRGGTMTYLCLKQGAPITAAATFGAPTDMWAAGRESPEMETRIFAKAFKNFEGNREEEYEKRSALRWAEKLTDVPLLIMHGDADETIQYSHTVNLSKKLAPLHSNFKTVIYPGGNHSLSTHMAAFIEETINWFERFRLA